MYVCMNVCMYECMYVYIYIYRYIHTTKHKLLARVDYYWQYYTIMNNITISIIDIYVRSTYIYDCVYIYICIYIDR